jgi:hypothetical protein
MARAHDPTGRVDRVLMRMLTGFGDLIRDVVNGDNGVEQHHDYEYEQEECKIVEKRIAHQSSALYFWQET